MKMILSVLAVLLVAGCQTAEEKARQAAERQASFHQKCVDYGLVRGTTAYARCRQELDLAYDRRRAAILGIMAGRMGQPAYTPPAMQPIPAPPPTVNTVCNPLGGSMFCTSR